MAEKNQEKIAIETDGRDIRILGREVDIIYRHRHPGRAINFKEFANEAVQALAGRPEIVTQLIEEASSNHQYVVVESSRM